MRKKKSNLTQLFLLKYLDIDVIRMSIGASQV